MYEPKFHPIASSRFSPLSNVVIYLSIYLFFEGRKLLYYCSLLIRFSFFPFFWRARGALIRSCLLS